MPRIVACFVLSSLLTGVLSGCGAIRIQGALNSNMSSVSGIVSAVNLTTFPGNGTTVVVTIVSFQEMLGFTTVNFCGDVRSRFPMNSFAQVNFQAGEPCSTILVIVISG